MCFHRPCSIKCDKRTAAAAAAKSLQSCLTLCDPIDGSPPGSTIPGILQARTLEWVAISFSNPWKWKVKGKAPSRVQLLATPWAEAYQAPLSMGFSRQEYWSGVPLPSPDKRGQFGKNYEIPSQHGWKLKQGTVLSIGKNEFKPSWTLHEIDRCDPLDGSELQEREINVDCIVSHLDKMVKG